ncbi:hypothetical protein BH23VER1_BH23VER1_17490 [soil metagenome]
MPGTLPATAAASQSASSQNAVPIVVDTLHEGTARVCQSSTAKW